MNVFLALQNKETAVHFPSFITIEAVGALTLHTGLNSR
jgi:hypothetical protein